MTRAREGGAQKHFFDDRDTNDCRRPNKAEKKETEEENKSSKSAKKESEDAPKETEEETSRPRGNKKESQEAKRRNETRQTPTARKWQWSENAPSVVGQESTRGERTFPS